MQNYILYLLIYLLIHPPNFLSHFFFNDDWYWLALIKVRLYPCLCLSLSLSLSLSLYLSVVGSLSIQFNSSVWLTVALMLLMVVVVVVASNLLYFILSSPSIALFNALDPWAFECLLNLADFSSVNKIMTLKWIHFIHFARSFPKSNSIDWSLNSNIKYI